MDSSGDVPNCVDGGPATNVFLAFSAKIIGNSMEVICVKSKLNERTLIMTIIAFSTIFSSLMTCSFFENSRKLVQVGTSLV